MALPNIEIKDFVGSLHLPKGQDEDARIRTAIAEFQNHYWVMFLTAQLFSDIRSTDPLPKKYEDLLLADFLDYKDKEGNKQILSVGVKGLIVSCIYSEAMKYQSRNTPTGYQKNKNENSKRISGNQHRVNVSDRYNYSIIHYNSGVLPFIRAFQNRKEEITSQSVSGSTLTIFCTYNQYLEVGDKVTIGGIAYPVLSVTENESFTIESANELPESTFSYSPFPSEIEFEELEIYLAL
ncbi:MAG: hypothetical protein AAF740_11625 [Bacteroidota bacterium]